MNPLSIPAIERKQVSVSVIIPCFRCSDTIGRAVESILKQTVLPTEIILVDDASGDGTLAILKDLVKAYSDLIKLIAFDENQGVADARNSAWDFATQDYIAFLDADDAWHPQKIALQYEYMVEHPNVVLSGHSHSQMTPSRGIPSWDITKVKASPISKTNILLSNRFITPSVMLRRNVPFRFTAGKRHMEDHLLWSQIICAGMPVVNLSAELAAIYKYSYGVTGLSAQSTHMHQGEIDNIAHLRAEGGISGLTAVFLLMFSWAKNIRRKVILFGRKLF